MPAAGTIPYPQPAELTWLDAKLPRYPKDVSPTVLLHFEERCLNQAHRGKIIGEPTGGSSGQPLMFKLPGAGAARVCTKHDSFADGREFVGVGVQPDLPIHLTREDYHLARARTCRAAPVACPVRRNNASIT